MTEYIRRLLATAVIAQAVIDFRIARQHNLIDSETLKAKENLPKRLPQQLEADDLATLKSFIFRDLEPFIDYTGLRISAGAVRRGIKSGNSSFKKFCSESSIQTYERRWSPNPLQPAKPKRKKRLHHGGKNKG